MSMSSANDEMESGSDERRVSTDSGKYDSESRPKKKRLSLVCSTCRAKRLKCDRQKPFCGRCVIENCTDRCTYDMRNSPPKDTLSDDMEMAKLRDKIKVLEDIVSYQRDMLEVARNTGQSHKPANLPKPFAQDATLPASVHKFDGYAVFESNLVYLEPTSYLSSTMGDSDLSIMFSELSRQMGETDLSCYNDADATSSTFLGNLPPFKDIDFLLDYFFKLSYPFISFFDKEELLSQFYHLLEDKGNYSTIGAAQSSHSSLIAMMLIMLRFAYITVSWDNPLLKAISSININETYVDCAVGLLMSPQSFKNLKIEKVKGLMLLRIYKMYCPEDDDTSYSTLVINSTLVSSARVLGMNRDMSKYPQKLLSVEEIQLWKDLWDYICYLDASYAFDKGTPPSTHLSELSTQLPDIIATPNAGQGARINQLLSISAKHLRVFLDGQITQRVIEPDKLLALSSNLSEILLKVRSFQQLTSQNHTKYDTLGEKAREFVLRLDLTYKEFTLYFLLYSVTDGAKQGEYLSKAFERSLIIFRILHRSAVQKEIIFGPELDRLIFPRLCIGPRMLSFIIMKITKVALHGEFSLLESLKNFNSPDSTGVIQWANYDFANEQNTLVNILKRVNEIYSECSTLSLKIYSCFKACMFMKIGIDYIVFKYPQVGVHMESTLGWKNPTPFEQVNQMWKKKYLSNNLFNFENSLAGLNNDLDDFLQGLEDPIWMQ